MSLQGHWQGPCILCFSPVGQPAASAGSMHQWLSLAYFWCRLVATSTGPAEPPGRAVVPIPWLSRLLLLQGMSAATGHCQCGGHWQELRTCVIPPESYSTCSKKSVTRRAGLLSSFFWAAIAAKWFPVAEAGGVLQLEAAHAGNKAVVVDPMPSFQHHQKMASNL